jgi:O-antigen/teichoic acid export membrane protein
MKKLIDALRSRFSKGRFARNTLIMMTGTGLAQAVSIAVAPILTRLYSPSDFGVLALYTSVSSLIGVLATGRYDTAIMLPEKDEDAMSLVAVSLSLTIAVGLASFGLVVCLNQAIARWLGSADVAPWLYLIPISVLVGGLYQAMYCWSVRRGQFKRVSAGKLSGASVGAVTTVGSGLIHPSIGGLILGGAANQASAAGILAWQLRGEDWHKVTHMAWSTIRASAKRYHRFPLYSLPADFVNVAAQQAPVILLSNFFGTTVVGFYSITQRALGLPLNLIASSITDVFRQRASADFAKQGSCRGIYVKTFRSLLAFSLIPFLVFFFTAPWLFSLIFGTHWRIAGEYAQIMAPLFFLRFVVSPLSYVLYVAGEQVYDLLGQVVLLMGSVASVWVGAVHGDPKLSLLLFSMSYSLVYLYYLAVSFRFSKR